MEKRKMTCIVCPVGCRLEVEIEDGKVKNVEGNTCPRGKKYAISEITNPTRTLTSTVKINSKAEKMLPVKTSQPIPKGEMLKAMKQIAKVTVNAPIKAGDTIIDNFIESGTKLIACKNVEK